MSSMGWDEREFGVVLSAGLRFAGSPRSSCHWLRRWKSTCDQVDRRCCSTQPRRHFRELFHWLCWSLNLERNFKYFSQLFFKHFAILIFWVCNLGRKVSKFNFNQIFTCLMVEKKLISIWRTSYEQYFEGYISYNLGWNLIENKILLRVFGSTKYWFEIISRIMFFFFNLSPKISFFLSIHPYPVQN